MAHPTFRLIAALVFCSVMAGCRIDPESKREVSASGMDSIVTAYRVTTDSVVSSWDRMIIDDDEKLFHIKRLLEEVTYTGHFDPVVMDSFMTKHSALVALRYDQKSMADSELIDEYDALTSELINEVTTFAKRHPDYNKYPLMEELIMDIMEADNRVLLHRIKYDNFCREFNVLIASQKSLLRSSGETELDEMALFTLSE